MQTAMFFDEEGVFTPLDWPPTKGTTSPIVSESEVETLDAEPHSEASSEIEVSAYWDEAAPLPWLLKDQRFGPMPCLVVAPGAAATAAQAVDDPTNKGGYAHCSDAAGLFGEPPYLQVEAQVAVGLRPEPLTLAVWSTDGAGAVLAYAPESPCSESPSSPKAHARAAMLDRARREAVPLKVRPPHGNLQQASVAPTTPAKKVLLPFEWERIEGPSGFLPGAPAKQQASSFLLQQPPCTASFATAAAALAAEVVVWPLKMAPR